MERSSNINAMGWATAAAALFLVGCGIYTLGLSLFVTHTLAQAAIGYGLIAGGVSLPFLIKGFRSGPSAG